MTKWLTTFVLLVGMAGNTLAGVPLPMHSSEKECPMTGMPDCCETAQKQAETPAVRMAQLCCSLNCSESGPTTPAGTFNAAPRLAINLQSATTPRPFVLPSLKPTHSSSPPDYQQQSHPAYIRHLALLI
jgi:hypothetical protein